MVSSNEVVRTPGRPQQSIQVRADLIHHARLLFIAHPYETVSLRMIASNAGVSMAMIRYYFNNKAGLFETMLRDTMSPMNQVIEAEGSEIKNSNSETNLLALLMTGFYKVMSRHKNFPKLIGRSMQLSREFPQRQIVEKVILEYLPLLQQKIQQKLHSEGTLQDGVSIQLSYYSLLNLLVFPFIAPPEILEFHGITITDDFLSDLLDHNIRLLSQGIIN